MESNYMPVYEFICDNCSRTFIERMSVKSYERNKKENFLKCPFCNNKTNKRVFKDMNFVLKGNGWFKDGYNKDGGE